MDQSSDVKGWSAAIFLVCTCSTKHLVGGGQLALPHPLSSPEENQFVWNKEMGIESGAVAVE